MTDLPRQRPFNQWLLEQRQGALHGELTARLAEVTAAVAEHQAKGTVTLTITIAPQKHDATAVIVSDDVKAKAPRGDRGASLFFVDDHGGLSRRDPRQPELPLSAVRSAESGQE
jgi:hypothetical protein